jgi:4-hydroxy-3-methylbut-2-en-1-yl diphosphate synthase IspG/GcpE
MLHTSDITETTQFHTYCDQRPPLQQLTMSRATANKATTALNRTKIALTLHQPVLLDIRFLSHLAYQLKAYNLSNKYSTTYVIPAVVSKINKTKVDLSIAMLESRDKPLLIDVTASSVARYVIATTPPSAHPDKLVIITQAFLNRHPCLRSGVPANYAELPEDAANALLDP